MTLPDASRLENLAFRARHAARSGNPREAMALWNQLLKLAPDDVEGLVQLGQLTLAAGDMDAAEDLLRRAIAREPRLAIAHAYMARIHIARGNTVAALKALDAAIHVDANAWGARLEKGRILDTLGRTREAAISWSAALQGMPPQAVGQTEMLPLIERARATVDADRRQLREYLDTQVAELMRGERETDLKRFRHCLDIATGRRAFVTAKPLMLPFPELPAIMFFDRKQFSWASAIEDATDSILAELQGICEGPGFEPYVQTRKGESAGQFFELDRDPGWSAYFLWKHGQQNDAHVAACPATASAVAHAPLVQIRARAPAVFFSRLLPGVHIPPHNGATNARLTVHLPLVIPEDCSIRVGDEARQWRMNELLVFDDTILHEAWNHSRHSRTVLIFDIWHPMLTPVERALVATTVEGLVGYYEGAEELGEL